MSASHAAVLSALSAHAGLTALVGSRIRVDLADADDAYPFIVIKRTALDIVRGMSGQAFGQTEAFDIECWAHSRDASINVAEQAITALELADMPPDSAQPDGIDPELLERVTVLSIEI